MPKMNCRQCGYTVELSKKAAQIGMLCPECHCQRLKPARERRRLGSGVVTVRPRTIRALIGGVILLLIGAAVVVWGLATWNAGRLGARILAYGVVLCVGGVVGLIAGAVSLFYDLRGD